MIDDSCQLVLLASVWSGPKWLLTWKGFDIGI
jgi:hypothetical protein